MMSKETARKAQRFGIIAFIAVIGFFVISPVHAGGGKDSGGGTASSNVPATLTITGLGNYAGNYIVATMSGDKIVAAADIGPESYFGQGYPATGGLIQNESITLPVWEMTSESEGNFELPLFTHKKAPYTGNETLSVSINIWKDGPGIFTGTTHHYDVISICALTVTFNNGSARIAFVPNEEWERLRAEW